MLFSTFYSTLATSQIFLIQNTSLGPQPVFLQLGVFKFCPILQHQPCNSFIPLGIFLQHIFFILLLNKSFVVIFAKHSNHPIIFNWTTFSPLALHCNNTVTLNIKIITCLKYYFFRFIILLWFRYESR